MQNKNFEQSLKRLEEIVEKLNDKHIDLESAIKLFEEGTLLCKNCEDSLKKAELVLKKYNVEQEENDRK